MKERMIAKVLVTLLVIFGVNAIAARPAAVIPSQPQLLAVDTSWRVMYADAGDQVILSEVVPGGTLQTGGIVEAQSYGETYNGTGATRCATYTLTFGAFSQTLFTRCYVNQARFIEQRWTIRMQRLGDYSTYAFVNVDEETQGSFSMVGYGNGPNQTNGLTFPNVHTTDDQALTLTWHTTAVNDLWNYVYYNSILTLLAMPQP